MCTPTTTVSSVCCWCFVVEGQTFRTNVVCLCRCLRIVISHTPLRDVCLLHSSCVHERETQENRKQTDKEAHMACGFVHLLYSLYSNLSLIAFIFCRLCCCHNTGKTVLRFWHNIQMNHGLSVHQLLRYLFIVIKSKRAQNKHRLIRGASIWV